MPPRKNGGDRRRKVLRVLRPGNDIRAALRIAELRRRRQQMHLRGPQFFHECSFQPSANSFFGLFNLDISIYVNFQQQQAES